MIVSKPPRRSRLLASAFAALCVLTAPSYANEPAPAPKPEPKKPERPSTLVGNAIPHCDAGKYSAGNFCRPSPPNYYVPSGARYPMACPKGSTAPAGSRALTECVFADGRSAGGPAEPAKPKSGH
jgi:hypothetical protein